MAYEPTVLFQKLMHIFKTVPMATDVPVSASVQTTTDSDGNSVVQVDSSTGDLYLDEQTAYIIATAVSQAVTEFLNEES